MEKEPPVFDALETLGKEHQEMLLQLTVLEGALGDLGKEQQAINSKALRIIEKTVRSLEIDFDTHLRKEEEVLFPPLSEMLGSEGGPIGVMLREHEDLRQHLLTLKRALETFRVEPNFASLGEVRQAGFGLIDFLRLHIKKEEACLLPLASQLVDKTQLVALGKEMLAIERAPGSEPG